MILNIRLEGDSTMKMLYSLERLLDELSTYDITTLEARINGVDIKFNASDTEEPNYQFQSNLRANW